MKETILRKLSSRKLWVAIIGIIVGLASAFGIEDAEWAQVAGIITSAVSAFAYIKSEATVDAAHKPEITEETSKGEDLNG